MIYGLQQERNFLCCTPNLRGYGERSHWPYKYHGPSTESGWIFILFKKKMSVRSDLWYAEHTEPNNTFVFRPHFWASEMKKKSTYIHTLIQKKKNSLKSSTSNRTGVWLLKTRGNRLLAFYWQRTKRSEWETEKVLSGDGINAIFQSCNL